ncbi:hypothetical protein SLEP1_g53628 [Rubroshorea leprosula]|uniref:NADH dehydrogenase subunit 4 n=1 Tax=Rubroshorea leprosula TaxID=152421 RepID=A0AAV5MB24_9ROSI|nr:hypothetical protein SLEP1_g53628 [Rubroshorea leprosula]
MFMLYFFLAILYYFLFGVTNLLISESYIGRLIWN